MNDPLRLRRLRRALEVLWDEGPRGVSERLRDRIGVGQRADAAYQVKLGASFDARWALIEHELRPESKTLIDLGSNLGAFTARAAQGGLWSIGLESSRELVQRSRRLHRDLSNCGFVRTRLTLDRCEALPGFDVALVLSVHHHWYQEYGPETADRMLRVIVSRTRHAIFFEGASRTGRYGPAPPDFRDNDEDSVVPFYQRLLTRVVGDACSGIRLLGKAPCVGEREPYRWMFVIEK